MFDIKIFPIESLSLSFNFAGEKISLGILQLSSIISVIGFLLLIFLTSFSKFIPSPFNELLSSLGAFLFVGGLVCIAMYEAFLKKKARIKKIEKRM